MVTHESRRAAGESGREYALRILKERIIRLELEPGSQISESELAADLGISRTPVREALLELSRVKVVEIYPQRGSYISLVDYDLVEEAQFMRDTLECAVVERCCGRELTAAQRDALLENIKLQEFYLDSRGHRLLELDNDFHRMLFEVAGLMQVFFLTYSMTIHFDRVRSLSITAVKEFKVVEDHRLIFEAILAQDAEGARAHMQKHLSRYRLDQEAIRALYPQYMKHKEEEI